MARPRKPTPATKAATPVISGETDDSIVDSIGDSVVESPVENEQDIIQQDTVQQVQTSNKLLASIEAGLSGATGITVEQQIVVQGDPVKVVQAFQSAVVRGARYKEGTMPRLNGHPRIIEMVVELDLIEDEWISDIPNGLAAAPIPSSSLIFSKEVMEGLSWEAFKKVVGKFGIGGRDRTIMTKEYLKLTDQ